jgi:hypothetical protein
MRYELSRRLQEKVIDLLGSVTRVSVETMRIVDAMKRGKMLTACAESAA